MRRLLFAAVVVVMTMAAAVPPPITVYTRVLVCIAPCDFHIRITVEPNPINRRVCLVAEIHTMIAYNACWNAGTRTEYRYLKKLDAGIWTVYATVERTDGKKLRSPPLTLRPRGIEDEPFDDFSTPTYDGP